MGPLVVAPKFLPKLRTLPETRLSHSALLVERHLGFYNGVNGILKSHQHIDVCKNLTQTLHEHKASWPKSNRSESLAARLIRSMSDGLEYASADFLTNCLLRNCAFFALYTTDDDLYRFQGLPTYDCVYSTVLSMSSRIFDGESHCRNEEWLQSISAHIDEVIAIARILIPQPLILRPLLRPFLVPKSRMEEIMKKSAQILLLGIKDRQNSPSAHLDLLQSLINTSPYGKLMPTMLKLLVLTPAAIRTACVSYKNRID